MRNYIWMLLLFLFFQLPVSPGHGSEDPAALPELTSGLEDATLQAESLFSEFSSRSTKCLRSFLQRSHSIGNDTIDKIDQDVLAYGPSNCKTRFALEIRNIRHNAHVEGEYNAENHHKFYLGHMIVHRIHLNRTASFIRRAKSCLRTCGVSCNSPTLQSKLLRWQRSAQRELERSVRDIQHAKDAYRELFAHGTKRFKRIERKAVRLVEDAVAELYKCSNRVYPNIIN